MTSHPASPWTDPPLLHAHGPGPPAAEADNDRLLSLEDMRAQWPSVVDLAVQAFPGAPTAIINFRNLCNLVTHHMSRQPRNGSPVRPIFAPITINHTESLTVTLTDIA